MDSFAKALRGSLLTQVDPKLPLVFAPPKAKSLRAQGNVGLKRSLPARSPSAVDVVVTSTTSTSPSAAPPAFSVRQLDASRDQSNETIPRAAFVDSLTRWRENFPASATPPALRRTSAEWESPRETDLYLMGPDRFAWVLRRARKLAPKWHAHRRMLEATRPERAVDVSDMCAFIQEHTGARVHVAAGAAARLTGDSAALEVPIHGPYYEHHLDEEERRAQREAQVAGALDGAGDGALGFGADGQDSEAAHVQTSASASPTPEADKLLSTLHTLLPNKTFTLTDHASSGLGGPLSLHPSTPGLPASGPSSTSSTPPPTVVGRPLSAGAPLQTNAGLITPPPNTSLVAVAGFVAEHREPAGDRYPWLTRNVTRQYEVVEAAWRTPPDETAWRAPTPAASLPKRGGDPDPGHDWRGIGHVRPRVTLRAVAPASAREDGTGGAMGFRRGALGGFGRFGLPGAYRSGRVAGPAGLVGAQVGAQAAGDAGAPAAPADATPIRRPGGWFAGMQAAAAAAGTTANSAASGAGAPAGRETQHQQHQQHRRRRVGLSGAAGVGGAFASTGADAGAGAGSVAGQANGDGQGGN